MFFARVFPFDCLELSSPIVTTDQFDSSLYDPSEIGRAYSPSNTRTESPYTRFSPPQLPQLARNDSPLGLTGTFIRSPPPNSSTTILHSQQASLVNNLLPPGTSNPVTPSEGSVLGDYQFQQQQHERESSRYSESDIQEEGSDNRGGEKGKRTSSLNANRDKSLFAALKGVLVDSDSDIDSEGERELKVRN